MKTVGIGNSCVDHRRFEGSDAGNFEVVNEVAGGKHCSSCTFFVCAWIHEFELHFSGGKGHAVEFESARFLYFAVGDWHMRDDRFADVRLPDTDRCHAVVRNA